MIEYNNIYKVWHINHWKIAHGKYYAFYLHYMYLGVSMPPLHCILQISLTIRPLRPNVSLDYSVSVANKQHIIHIISESTPLSTLGSLCVLCSNMKTSKYKKLPQDVIILLGICLPVCDTTLAKEKLCWHGNERCGTTLAMFQTL